MTAADAGRTTVVCPVCFDTIDWHVARGTCWAYSEDRAGYEIVDLSGLDAVKQTSTRRGAYVQCPNPSGDAPLHYLPAMYGEFERPIVVGLVGSPVAGKTYLLTAMIQAIRRDGLRAVGVTAAPLDPRRDESFRRACLDPFTAGRGLGGTPSGVHEYAAALLLSGPGGTRPVVFLDVAGEDFQRFDRPDGGVRFLLRADALLFLDAVEYESRRRGGWGDPAVAAALDRVRLRPDVADVHAAVVVAKADRLRYAHPVDRWYGAGVSTSLDAAAFAAETEDAYAFLHSRGALTSLAPFEVFRRCTMHFVSATGHDAVHDHADQRSDREVRPDGVLRPLVAILAMSGLLVGEEARRVGTSFEPGRDRRGVSAVT